MARGGYRPGAGRKPSKPVDVTAIRDRTIDANWRERAPETAKAVLDATGATPMATVSEGKFRDYQVNYAARLGLGAQNILTSTTQSQLFLSRIRTRLEWMYAEQFVCKNAVDVVAEDMTRQGVDITGPLSPKDIAKIQNYAMQMDLWSRLRSVIKWARLYGGCVGFLQIDGQKPDTPLRLETVGPGQFKGIIPLDRWMIDPSLEDLVNDPSSPQVGQPRFYRVTADAPALPRMKIHYSRVIRLIGNEVPYWRCVQENLWGISVLETIQDRIIAFDLGSSGAAQLINKSFIRTFKVEGLKELIGSNEQAYQGLRSLVDVMTSMQGIEGVTLMDTKDEYEGHEHGAFSGLAEILQEFRQQLSGALQIPLTKLFGQAPAGMNATGESDIRGYYDLIKARQMSDLHYPLTIVYRLLAQSCGVKWTDECGIEFRPLWQPTEKEKAEIAKTITETVLMAEEKGTVSTQTTMQELKQQSKATGVWTNITEKDIKAALDMPVPAASIVMPGEEGGDAPPAKPAAKPKAKGKDSAWGHSTNIKVDTTFGNGNINVIPEPWSMPSGVTPGARPFQDGDSHEAHGYFHGLPIHLENEKGTMRRSKDPSNPWQAVMCADYGYICGTGSAEGATEGMDCFVGPSPESTTVYVINQRDLKTGGFDEHKCMLCFASEAQAISAYVSSYSDLQGMDRIMSIRTCSMDEFKKWLGNADKMKPYTTIDSYYGSAEMSKVDGTSVKATLEHVMNMTGDPAASMDPTLAPSPNVNRAQ